MIKGTITRAGGVFIDGEVLDGIFISVTKNDLIALKENPIGKNVIVKEITIQKNQAVQINNRDEICPDCNNGIEVANCGHGKREIPCCRCQGTGKLLSSG